jgi:hypothetical protein
MTTKKANKKQAKNTSGIGNKKGTTKKATKKATKKKSARKRYSKDDPEFYSKIGKLAGDKVKKERGTKYFSRIAKKSHPRAEYHGGRPRKSSTEKNG